MSPEKSNLNQGRLTDAPLSRIKIQWFPLETIWFLIGWQYYRQPMRNHKHKHSYLNCNFSAKKTISKRFSLNKWMILFQIYVNVANHIGELSIGCQYNCTPCWMKVCFNKEGFEWSLKITWIFTLSTKAAEKHWYNKSRKACYHNICICQHTSTKLIAKFNHQRQKFSLTCEIWEFYISVTHISLA